MLKVNEIFNSIQGEGPAAGEPATFIRLSGCNLKCTGCDTDHSISIEFSIEETLPQISNDLVVITGGEPTLQLGFNLLVERLFAKGHTIDIETNGTNQIAGNSLSRIRNVVISPKRGSKVTLESNYGNVWYKFVIGSAPWTWIFSDIEDFRRKNPSTRIYLMPYGADLQNASTVWDYCVSHNIRYSDRLQWRVNRK
jgi:organic radical activating enzyme